MTTSVETYRNDLLLALRLRDVPGPRIAEVLAEVDSHVADTGEDPREGFGPPREYAERVAAAIGLPGRGGWRGWVQALRGPAGLVGVLVLAGGWLFATGLFHVAAGTDGPAGLPGLPVLAAGLLFGLGGLLLLRGELRRADDRVLDPRTGFDMAPNPPRWAGALAVGVPVLLLVVCVVLGLAAR